jgi:methyl-accepting chemotaxis protein
VFNKRKTTKGFKNINVSKIAGHLKKLNILKNLKFRPKFGVGTKLQVVVVLTVFVTLAAVTGVVTMAYRNSIIADRMQIMQTTLDNIAEQTNRDNLQLGSVVVSMAVSQANGSFGQRLQSLKYAKDLLQRFPNIMGAYINYEPNADGQDHLYGDRVLYTDDGRFIPYWYWQDGVARDVILLTPSEELEDSERYTATQNKWQELVGSNAKTEEFLYYSEPFTNQNIPMISISYPLVIDEQFRGIVGIDRSLNMLYEQLKDFKPYASASLFLLSREGQFVTSTGEHAWRISPGDKLADLEEYNKTLGKYFSAKVKGITKALSPLDDEPQYFIFSPIKMGNWMLAMAVNEEEIIAPVNVVVKKISYISAVAFLILVIAIWGTSRLIIVRPVRRIMNLFSEIGLGNFDARIKAKARDEIGEMATSLNAMLDNTLVLIQSREERDAIQTSIMKLLDEISGLAEGDLTRRAEVTAEVTGAIADSFNTMAEQLSGVVKNVKQATDQVTTTTEGVNASTKQLSEASEKQARRVSNTIKVINEMADSIKQVAENAVRSSAVSKRSTVNAKEGAAAVQSTNKAMNAIRDNVQETARSIKRLGESSQEIGNIVQLINDIADRTSILALNASIQAAMAGDAGRGFAVVAEEVQRLAERSTNATKQIDTLIKNIQGEINEAGTSMEESIQRVVEGSNLAENAHKKLQEIETVSTKLAKLIQSISNAATKQSKASENITKNMEQMGVVSSHNLTASRQTALAIERLAETSKELAASVETFKVADKSDARQPVQKAPQETATIAPVKKIKGLAEVKGKLAKVKSLMPVEKMKVAVKAEDNMLESA